MTVDDNYITTIVNKGINNVTTAELIHGYQYVTGEQLRGSCSGCVKRKGWNTILNYYKLNIEKNDK